MAYIDCYLEQLKREHCSHKEVNKGFTFDKFLKENKISDEKFDGMSEEEQEKYYADYEQQKSR